MKPVLFNTDMVRANKEGRKGVTRRLIKPMPPQCGVSNKCHSDSWSFDVYSEKDRRLMYSSAPYKPPYKIGEKLYVREKWAVDALSIAPDGDATIYAADFTDRELQEMKVRKFKWKPSIHMPRDKARIFLRVTDVRVERLQDITAEEALLEGIEVNPLDMGEEDWEHYYRACFAALWDTTIRGEEKDKYGWDANPWVWVIHYERCEKPAEETE